MLQAHNIHKSFDGRGDRLTVLRDATLDLQAGQSASIMGPSGSGKSTLLNIIGTLESPTGGTVRIDGVDVLGLGEHDVARFRNRKIGFVFQEHHLLPQLSVFENVLLPTLAFADGEDRTDRGRDLLKRVGLADRLDHRPAELSGGERQRAATARALIQQPAVLLADEPTGNLDRATADVVADLLDELHKEENLVLIVVTHSERLADRFEHRFDLQDGQLVGR